MKTYIKKHQKTKSICRVLNSFEAAFEDKPKALELKANLNEESEAITELISQLLRPASVIHRPKQDSQQKLISALQEHIGMGILMATHLNNKPLLDILKVYKSKLQFVSAYKLYEMAVHVHEELQKNAELAVEFGLSAEMLTSFEAQVADFGETLDTTGALLTSRRAGRRDLYTRTNACSKMIRMKLDPFIIFNEKEFPELYKEYMLVRGSRKRRKYIAKDEALADISGTTTDSVTGLPLTGVTINLVEHESAFTTDDDGYYLLDELVAGTYTITCHATGYEVPETVVVTVAAGESLVVDFSLVPITQPA